MRPASGAREVGPTAQEARRERASEPGQRFEGLLWVSSIESPIGALHLAAGVRGVVKLGFSRGPRSDFNAWLASRFPGAERAGRCGLLDEAGQQIRSYFAGELQRFDVPLDLYGTPFQRAVWEALGQIPYGATRTYGALAEQIRRPGAARAVGSAVGANPVPLLLPCHRVIASGGRLGGFGGGSETKRRLLALEGLGSPLLSGA